MSRLCDETCKRYFYISEKPKSSNSANHRAPPGGGLLISFVSPHGCAHIEVLFDARFAIENKKFHLRLVTQDGMVFENPEVPLAEMTKVSRNSRTFVVCLIIGIWEDHV